MPSDDLIPRVRLLIANLRLEVGPHVPSPQDVCRHVALRLGISEASAREMILRRPCRMLSAPAKLSINAHASNRFTNGLPERFPDGTLTKTNGDLPLRGL
jgi:hypothetical protein